MKRVTITKTASLLALTMLLSLTLPLVAAAAVWFDPDSLDFDEDGTVKGKLLSDESITEAVYIEVLDSDMESLLPSSALDPDVIEATYSNVTNSVYWTYDFNFKVTEDVYDKIYLRYQADHDVVSAVYRDDDDNRRRGGGGLGWGWVPSPRVDDGNIDLGNRSEVPADVIEEAFENNDKVSVTIDGDTVLLPAQALKGVANNPNAEITIVSENGTYTLPLSALNFDELASELGVDLEEMNIRVEIKKVEGSTAQAITNRIEELGAEQAADAIDFAVRAEDEDGNSVSINSFGNTFVSRSIPLHHSVETDKTTGVVYDPETEEFYFVPSVFSEEDGETTVTIMRNSNSIYTVVSFDKSFSDIPQGHWAEEDITTLANKLIVHGVSEDRFDLDRSITRAEFAALVVRSLGIQPSADATVDFSDVPANAWYAAEVAAAVEAGLVYGYDGNTFRPNNIITREELASLVVRAMAYAGADVGVSLADQAETLGQFRDAQNAGSWAQDELAYAIQAEVVHGMGSDILAPKGTATRAQAAAMLYRYLQNVGFINE